MLLYPGGPTRAQNTCTDAGRKLGTNQDGSNDTPPPYESSPPEKWIANQTYDIIRTSQRLVEVLTTASAGPSGTTARAWNLYVNASVETAIELLKKYNCVAEKPAGATPSSYLELVSTRLELQDEQLRATAIRTFSAIKLMSSVKDVSNRQLQFYTLRSPREQRFLSSEPQEVPKPTLWDLATATPNPFSAPLSSSLLIAIYFLRHNKTAVTQHLCMRAQGQGSTSIAFLAAESQPAAPSSADKENSAAASHVHFNMLVKLALDLQDVSHNTVMVPGSSGGEKSGRGQDGNFCVIHCDERYRNQECRRAVTIRDRIMLKEESTGKLLCRKQVSDNEWSVDVGHSDDYLWTVGVPL